MLNNGDRVPSTRVLASELDVARGTVESAYSMLLGEGILISRGQAGSYINAPFKLVGNPIPAASKIPIKSPIAGQNSASPSYVFLPGSPAYDAFPRKIWSRLASRRMRSLSASDFSYRDPLGYLPLRQSIAGYLRLSRGVVCEPGQIFITMGYQGALDFLVRCLSLGGRDVWMEDPGYILAKKLLDELGINLVRVPVDHEGLIVSEGIRLSPEAKLAIVTPSHHSPLGMALSWSRRMQLLDWTGKAGAWVIEDDYDGEFRYSGYPLPSLKSLDQYDRVIYAGTFSKTLFPALRLGYVVLPQSLVDVCAEKAHLFQSGMPITSQLIVNDFIAEGHFSRHLKKMRALYAERREITRKGLTNIFEDKIEINTHKNGMHVLAKLMGHDSDKAIVTGFNKLGYGIHALSNWTADSSHNGLILGFTNISNEKTAEHAARQLRECFA
ncbi:MocR-like pyridoxine biosynthesis transcription factor PdxR [Methylobacillus gramineus]|uniref:MocR-like pyridoxine biosynthesis transcription factor PdxR n=1 Tax=Methylobacillus gramineus TaxID=755169 RepID=UPI0038512549